MKCRGLPPAIFQPAGAKASAPGGSEGAVEPCAGLLDDETFTLDLLHHNVFAPSSATESVRIDLTIAAHFWPGSFYRDH